MLTSHLYCNTTLGPAQVSVDVRGCVSVGDSFSTCSLVGAYTCCFPNELFLYFVV